MKAICRKFWDDIHQRAVRQFLLAWMVPVNHLRCMSLHFRRLGSISAQFRLRGTRLIPFLLKPN